MTPDPDKFAAEQFRLLADAVPHLVWVADARGHAEYFNRRWYAYTGLTEAQSVGDGWWQTVHADDLDAARVRWERCLAAGTPFEAEYRRRGRDGEWRWFLGRGSPVRDATGEVVRWVGSSTDIDDAKRRTDAQDRESAALRGFIENLPELAWSARPDGHIDYYNRRWYEYTGTVAADMEGWGWQSVHDPEILPAVLERWRDSIATGAPFEMEFPLRGADGVFRWFLTRVQPLRGGDGAITGWVGTNANIDDRRRVERDAQVWRARYEAVIRASGMLLYDWDIATDTIVHAGDHERTLGCAASVLGTTLDEWVQREPHPDDRDTFRAGARGGDGADLIVEFRLRRADGGYVHVEDAAHFVLGDDGRASRRIGFVRDVTVERAAAAAQERAARHALLIGRVGDALTRGATLRATLDACAGAVVELLGVALARIWTVSADEPVLELQASAGTDRRVDGDDARVAVGASELGRIVEDGRPARRDAPGDAFAGHPLVISGRVIGVVAMFAAAPLDDAAVDALGAVADAIALGIDRIRAEEARARSEERYRLSSRASKDAIWDWDVRTDRVEWNDGLAELFGYAADAASRETRWWDDHVHPDDLERVASGVRAALAAGADTWRDEYRFRRVDGTWANVTDRGFVSRDLLGRPVRMVGAIQDVTERTRTEARLRVLAATSTVLQDRLDPDHILEQVAQLPVPSLGDWCAIDLRRDDGRIERVAIHHVDPAAAAVARAHAGDLDLVDTADHGVGRVIRTGETEWMADAPADLLADRIADPRQRAALESLGIRSYVMVPLRSHGRVFGAMTIVYGGSGRRYDASDLPFVEELARRVAVSLDLVRVASDLARSEHLFRGVVENLPALAWSARPDGYIDFYNQSWYDYTGTRYEEMAGWGWKAVHDPAIVDEVVRGFSAAIEAGTAWEMEFPLRGADGVYRWFLTRMRPLRDGAGRIVRWFGTNTNVDDRLREAAERQRLLARLQDEAELLDTLNRVGTLLAAELDQEALLRELTGASTRLSGARYGAFAYCAEAASSLPGDATPTVAGAPAAAADALAAVAARYGGEGVSRIDDVRVDDVAPATPEGVPAIASFLQVPVRTRGGDPVGALRFAHDEPGMFDERDERLVVGVAAQAAVALDNARLFREARTLILALEKSNEELDRFAYVASHDLKAPLRGISNVSQWLEEDLGDRMTDTAREQMRMLRSRVLRLEGLIDGILQYSRAGRGKPKLVDVDVGQLVREVIELLAPPPGARVVIAPDLPQLTTGRVLLEQVLMNLIGNAFKYNPSPEPLVEVSARDAGAWWELAVRDDGPGIAPRFHDRVWRIFQTLQSRDRRESTGVGLAVVRKIVESTGGAVAIDSVEGQGATFRFTWPKVGLGERR